MFTLEGILYSCLICLHFFDLGVQDSNYVNLQDNTCNTCLNDLFKEPKVNSDLYYIEKVIKEGNFSLDNRFLPFLREMIEEKIRYAYENTDAHDFSKELLNGLSFDVNERNRMRNQLYNLLRKIYHYENDVKSALEEQKESMLKKIDQNVEEMVFSSRKLKRGEKAQERMEIMGVVGRMKQEEAKRSAAILVINEKTNIMKKYSKVVVDFYAKLKRFELEMPTESRISESYLAARNSAETLKVKFYTKEMRGQHPGFEEIFLKFNNTLAELSKEIDQQDGHYINVLPIFEKLKIDMNEFDLELSRETEEWVREAENQKHLENSNKDPSFVEL